MIYLAQIKIIIKIGIILALLLPNLEIMNLQETKKPKWKIKEELNKAQSFDSSLAELGTNGEFLKAQKVSKTVKKATSSKNEVADSCTAE